MLGIAALVLTAGCQDGSDASGARLDVDALSWDAPGALLDADALSCIIDGTRARGYGFFSLDAFAR